MLIKILAPPGRFAAVVSLCVAALPSLARTQEPRRLTTSDSIPLELATALVSAGGVGGDPQILVGSLPGWVSDRIYLPPLARVLGAAFIGQTVVGVVAVSETPETAIADFKRELPSHGWKTPPTQPSYGGGFRPAPATAQGVSPTNILLCGDQQMLVVSAARHRGTNTLVIVRITPASLYSRCNPPPVPAGMTGSPFPTLFNPASAVDGRPTGDCSGTLGGTAGTGTNLHTVMSADAILSHYGKQLLDSGWLAPTDRITIVGRSWTRTDSTGSPVELSLTIVGSPRDSTCHDISMQVKTLRKP